MTASSAPGGDIPFPPGFDPTSARSGPFDTGFSLEEGDEHGAGEAAPVQGELMASDADALLAAFQAQVQAGRAWFDALLDCIRQWETPRESVGGRDFVYLIEREAFDWLLLAERVCDSAPPGLLPPAEVEALLIDETPPARLSEAEFQERLGTAKYWAHLNFLYGVRVEQALHLAMERTVQKERGGWATDGSRGELELDVFGRIYGARQRELLREFRQAGQRADAEPERIEHAEWQAFTYWLFRRRLERQDPARVASDTRRGLEMLYELEAAKQRRQRRLTKQADRRSDDSDVIVGVLVGVG